MAKYLFVYHGGKMASNPQEAKEAMNAWGAWFGALGAAVIDGGNPVAKSHTVKADGSLVSDGGANPVERLQPYRGRERRGRPRQGQGVPAAQGRRDDRDRPGDGHVTRRRTSLHIRMRRPAPTGQAVKGRPCPWNCAISPTPPS